MVKIFPFVFLALVLSNNVVSSEQEQLVEGVNKQSNLKSIDYIFHQKKYQFKLPSQELHFALIQIANISGLTLFLPIELVEGLESRAIDGYYSLEEAFDIALQDTALEISVSEQGQLKISRIQDFQLASLDSAYPVKEKDKQHQIEELLVTGIHDAFITASQFKQDAINIVEAVTEEDVSKLPDTNVAEALQRLPGLQMESRGGEGSIIRIRGFNQNRVLFNGESFLTGLELFQSSDNNYEGSFESIPIDLLTRVEVHKTPVSSALEGGVGGTINLVSRRGLDLTERLVVSELSIDQGKYTEGASPNGFIVLGDNWGDRFAGIMSIAYENRYLNTDEIALFTPGGEYKSTTV